MGLREDAWMRRTILAMAVMPDDARLADSRNPLSHTHSLADVTDYVAPDPTPPEWTNVVLGSDFTTDSASLVDVTGLFFTPAASTAYEVKFCLLARTSVVLIGAAFGVTMPTGLSDSAHNLPGTVAMAATGTTYLTTGSAVVIAGASPSGNVQVRFASGLVLTNVTLRAGSFLSHRVVS